MVAPEGHLREAGKEVERNMRTDDSAYILRMRYREVVCLRAGRERERETI